MTNYGVGGEMVAIKLHVLNIHQYSAYLFFNKKQLLRMLITNSTINKTKSSCLRKEMCILDERWATI